jgi:hypothetical protein
MDVKTSVDLTGTFAEDLHTVLHEAAQQGPLATDEMTGAASAGLSDSSLRRPSKR